nr:right-handed parallel beta-helix repeat-containing protein [uncultured Carboxylicivirga sp.]
MKSNLLIIFSFIFLLACSKEYIEKPGTDEPETDNPDTEEPIPGDDVETVPCDFDFNTIEANDTLNIVCNHDLSGETINIPSNVIINYYSGGAITNGTLYFEDNGIIDGRILNYKLNVEGNVKLKSTTFQLNINRWNITEGIVSDEVAITNKKALQKALDDSKRLGATIFNTGDFDAYFNVTYDYFRIAAISIPSDLIFQLNDNTHIRVQPNKEPHYVLIQMREVSNVEILGGKFYGDRDEHDYNSINSTHEGGCLIDITASHNILVNGALMRDATGDGLDIGCIGTYTDRGNGLEYLQSMDIKVTNCTFDSNRRNGISPGDGVRVTIDRNQFLNSGVDTEKSKGTAPRCAIDVESWWELDENQNLIRYHTTTDFVISNNIERGGANISFLVAVGENVTFDGNDVEQRIGFNTGRNLTIKNNKVKSQIIVGNGAYRTYQENFQVYDNVVEGDTLGGIGIYFQAYEAKVFNNTINGKTTGIAIRNSGNSDIYNNIINLPKDLSITYGIFAYAAIADNVHVSENKIHDCKYMPISFNGINNIDGGENNYVTISDTNLDGDIMSIEDVEKNIYNSKGVVVK